MQSPGTPSLTASLESLPVHILEYICQYVPRRSLFSLSFVSRGFCLAATPGRFSRVRLTITDKEKLLRDLDQWNAILGRDDRFRYVRRVVVIGCMGAGEPQITLLQGTLDVDSEDTEDESNIEAATKRIRFSPGSPTLSPQHKQGQHEAWLPFVQFLSRLPALRDFVYACTHQLPACVLEALHQHHPKSRLHMHTFSLRSLHQERDQLHDIDPDEYALATSPCLYSIRARCTAYDSDGRFSFNLEALEHMVASGCAPGLKQLSIQHVSPSGTLSLVEALQAPRDKWKGFFSQDSTSQPTSSLQQPPTIPRRGRLEALVISGNRHGPHALASWSARTNFSLLRRFHHHCGVSLESLQTLISMATNNQFRSLADLALGVYSKDGDESTPAVLDQPTASFLHALPRLKNLSLSGHFGADTMTALLTRHGAALRALHLRPAGDDYVESDDYNDTRIHGARIRAIQRHCPRLEDLTARVRRLQGAPAEVAVYRALGRMRRLRRATLLLDCRAPLPGGRGGHSGAGNTWYWERAHDMRHPGRRTAPIDVEQIRATMVNLAVDEALARAIFHEISSSAVTGDGVSALRRLRLETTAEDMVKDCYGELRGWALWVARSWACVRDGAGGEVMVRELGGMAEGEREYMRDVHEEIAEYKGEDVWSRIWPREGEDWRDGCRSFPLSTQGGEAGTAGEDDGVEL